MSNVLSPLFDASRLIDASWPLPRKFVSASFSPPTNPTDVPYEILPFIVVVGLSSTRNSTDLALGSVSLPLTTGSIEVNIPVLYKSLIVASTFLDSSISPGFTYWDLSNI